MNSNLTSQQNISRNQFNGLNFKSASPQLTNTTNNQLQNHNHNNSNIKTYQQNSWSLIPESEQPPPTFYPINQNPSQQALFTTYPSRLRLGTTSLVQPIYTNTYIQQRLQRANSPIDNINSSIGFKTIGSNYNLNNNNSSSNNNNSILSDFGSGSSSSRRNRKVVNYSEQNHDLKLSEIELEYEEENKNKNTNTNYNNHNNNTNTNNTNNLELKEIEINKEIENLSKRKFGDGKSYLGQRPPGKFIKVQKRVRKPNLIMNSINLIEINERGIEDDKDEEKQNENEVEEDNLIPIRVEFETEDLRIRDVFTWNLKERHITPEAFATEFCYDIDISPSLYVPKIVEQINSQLKDLGTISSTKFNHKSEEIQNESKELQIEPDIRVIINLDVQIQTLHLVDKIEWDLSSNLLTPELFTNQYINELNLPNSSKPIISHAIHEEILKYKKDYLLNYKQNNINHNSQINNYHNYNDPLLRLERKFLKKLEGIWRDWNECNLFGPKIEEIKVEDIEWFEIEKERQMKKARRETLMRTGRRR
ncbi:hypothetical protein CROQUDRAFT_651922 [Cronartium quercuum f. sp. fusiforme G11]|uniref:SNF5-domain-containing protein n=1 Tax=Cronartium quercuum f. sp. fusiforme G11 TaxID=708437 RepID=A0A9P6NUU8_9BASI|nr:hypothetical protein CROQUDRAFT_651922 [Cronartium quercuum f. sp. fusiforme G11]